jgi:ribose-phosphate pyrophosphokinase
MTVIGEVEGKHVIIVDDMCDTAGTLTASSALFMENGATSVRAFCTHAVLSGPAFDRIEASTLTEVIVTDTIPHERKSPKVRTLSVDKYFASVIDRLLKNESIGGDYYK